MPQRSIHKPIGIIRWGLAKTSQNHHPVPVSQAAMARCAVDIEAGLTPFDVLFGDGDWKLVDVLAVNLAGVPGFVNP
jgi:hypothetical protein